MMTLSRLAQFDTWAHWAELKPLVEKEGLELSIPAVLVPPIAKANPTPTTTNQLGTLGAAAA
jgi:hypothetical protein